MVKRIVIGIVLLFATSSFAQQQQFASLGDFKLDSGEVLKDCRIGYRTFGKLNADKSNVVLFPTWAGGTTEQLAGNFGVGPGHLVDTSKYYVIAVDALSNGVSSSPSNSVAQPHMHFPQITIRDMVNTEHELLTRVLGIKHVAVVMGISMGGMQTFQWIATYPDFMDRAIPIVGSPQMTAFDILQWQTQIDAVKNDPGWNHGDYQQNPSRMTDSEFGMLLLTTPENVNSTHKPQQVLADVKKDAANPGQDANNKIRQSEAMMSLDVTKEFYGGTLDAVAHGVKAKLLVIVSKYDHTVNPEPAMKFAQAINAPVLELTGNCGHLATACEEPKVEAAVKEFLGNGAEAKEIRVRTVPMQTLEVKSREGKELLCPTCQTRGITPPHIASATTPQYSESARRARYQGIALLSLVVNKDGEADNIRVKRSLGMGLDQNAIECVRQWKFNPGTKNGAPVPVEVQVEVPFRLD